MYCNDDANFNNDAAIQIWYGRTKWNADAFDTPLGDAIGDGDADGEALSATDALALNDAEGT